MLEEKDTCNKDHIHKAYQQGFADGVEAGKSDRDKELREKIGDYKTKILNDKTYDRICNPDCHLITVNKILDLIK